MSTKFNALNPSDKNVLLEHIKALGLDDVDDYIDWCSSHGFTRGLVKTGSEREKEKYLVRQIAAEQTLRTRATSKFSVRTLQSAFIEKTVQSSSPAIKLAVQLCDKLKDAERRSFGDFTVSIFERCPELISSDAVENRPAGARTYLHVLRSVIDYRDFWIRDIVDWLPKSHNRDKNLAALLRHLFAKYEVPSFLDSAWTTSLPDASPIVSNYQSWFIEIGQGASVRGLAGFPYNFTKKQAHSFLQAPAGFSVSDAVIYGLIIGAGGDSRLVEGVMGSPLGRAGLKTISEFWNPLINLFIANPMLDRNQFQQIYDYVTNQKFVGNPPPQPGFSWKGRTPDTLIRQTEEWHSRLAKQRTKNYTEWKPTAISWFEKEESVVNRPNHKIWTIEELTNSKELSQEGTAQRTCVGSYARSCLSGATSIWSMRLTSSAGNKERVMTIEVNNRTGSIVQARGFANSCPEPKPWAILVEWANKAGLSITAFRSRFR
jgi:hypothetical protein